ncbi:MAG: bacteriohemerythrin [Caldicoprobacterales bacterium]|jgi:hemerythrin|nr:hemerythrin family protein [Clostridiales bacterium]
MYFEWKDSYELGVEKIDKQHRKLFSIGDRLAVLIQTKEVMDNYEEVRQILNELKDYTLYHFSSEEKLMREISYHDIVNHAIEHNFLRKKLKEIDTIEEANHKVVVKLVSFLSDWISHHILITDVKVGNYIRTRK